jgi:hypothetical protein
MRTLAARLVVVAGCALGVVACSVGETRYETVVNPVRKVSTIKTCTGPFAKPDLGSLTPCGDGHGHCYAGSKTLLPELLACTGGSGDTCIPDKVLEANGAKLKACTFLNGKPGACLSMMVKQIAEHKNDLQQDVCEEDERCTPCINPLNGVDTKLCEGVGVYAEACKGGAGAKEATCCHGQGVCMTREGVPEDSREDMLQDTCKGDNVCAPAAMVDGNPETCSVLGADGVCIDLCFAKMLGPAATVIRAGCGATSVCLPCVVGKSRGMPGCD